MSIETPLSEIIASNDYWQGAPVKELRYSLRGRFTDLLLGDGALKNVIHTYHRMAQGSNQVVPIAPGQPLPNIGGNVLLRVVEDSRVHFDCSGATEDMVDPAQFDLQARALADEIIPEGPAVATQVGEKGVARRVLFLQAAPSDEQFLGARSDELARGLRSGVPTFLWPTNVGEVRSKITKRGLIEGQVVAAAIITPPARAKSRRVFDLGKPRIIPGTA